MLKVKEHYLLTCWECNRCRCRLAGILAALAASIEATVAASIGAVLAAGIEAVLVAGSQVQSDRR